MKPSIAVVVIVAYGTTTVLVYGTATFISGTAHLSYNAPRNPSDGMIIDNYAILSFITVDILLAKTFIILVLFVFLLEIIHKVVLHLPYFLIYF